MKKLTLFLMLFCVIFTSNANSYPALPDVPGALCTTGHRDFKEYRYHENIPYCKRNVSRNTKTEIYMEYGIPLKQKKSYTIDHIIPLSLGGDNSRDNLWPEHKHIKSLRPNFEYDLFLMLRDGEITQAEAVEAILKAKFNPYKDPYKILREVLETSELE